MSERSIQEMKDVLKRNYPSDAWRRKVDAMSDNQVIAIYRRIQESEYKTNLYWATLVEATREVNWCYYCSGCGEIHTCDVGHLLEECPTCGSKYLEKQ